ncbi:hypothetical protein BBF96_01355 [Anoxybacter fermentans]|uniref:Rad50/SbcC-type AAA domain-containing protein n=1 Tax=Anoxybacter fermentans TaxID=1323375 RepID=A0A3S9SV20_9FIRM|nr:AAA family ATPase [Anoxybacter fermentans]AZR72157.1 hypothetical protein BBF96_01355 [Anoxybacter fermentans]
MIIRKIKLVNFKQYYGEQEVVLSRSKLKNVTIINGKNGAGKTNFFTAINWCLYGENVVKIEGEIINKNALKEASIDSFVEAKVLIYFDHKGKSYLMKRVIMVKKIREDEYQSQGPSEVQMFELDHENNKQCEIPDPLTRLNLILPSNVRTYFLFDGERIDEFARPDHEYEVWYAVRNVLKLEVIERGKDHLYSIANKYSRELRNYSTGRLAELLEEEERYKKDKEKLQQELEKFKIELKECEREIDIIEKKQSEIKEIQLLTQKRDSIRKKIRDLEMQLAKCKRLLQKDVSRASLIFGEKALNLAENLISSRVQDNYIPSGILKNLYQKIIQEEVCICGREVKRHSSEYKKLIGLISQEGIEEGNQSFLIELKANIRAAKQKKEDLLESIRSYYTEWRELQADIDYLIAQEDDISKQFSESELENVAKLEERRKNLLTDKGVLQNKIETTNDEIDKLTKKIKEVRDQIEKEELLKREMDLLKRKKVLAEQSAQALEEIYNRFAKEMRIKIEEKASEIFQKLIRKKRSFIKVSLNEDYQLRLIDRFGDEDARSEISAGERQVLSLAFILGLAQVSEEEAPLVMDTPFGRLDSEHRRNIVSTIPLLTPQLVLFVTDEELDDENRQILQDKVGAEYTLIYDDHIGNTRIVRDL